MSSLRARRIARNPFAFPGGNPGFNPAHPASIGVVPRYAFSWVGGGPTDLLTASPVSATRGSPTYQIDGVIGPVFVTPSVGQGIQYTNIGYASSGLNAAATLALIIYHTGSSTNADVFYTSNSSTSGWGVSSGANLLLRQGASTTILFSTPAAGYYFFAVSAQSAGAVNAVLMNLMTGSLKTFSGMTAASTTTGTGDHIIGTSAATPITSLAGMKWAAAAHTPNLLPLPQLVKWSFAPWEFWYPN